MIPFHGNQYPGRGGHYESWFVRANDPRRPRALWIRYTQFISADGRRRHGELWAIWFDAEADRVVAVKESHSMEQCRFDRGRLAVEIGESRLESGMLIGTAASGGHRLDWHLNYSGDQPPLLLLPESYYRRALPKAKSLVSRPAVRVSGTLNVDGEEISIRDWPGSENHNWGERHTDQYAWGQVAGFDDHPDAFLECATARVKLGPVPTPRLSIAVLRLDGETYAFNSLSQALGARGQYQFFQWRLRTHQAGTGLDITLEAPASRFAGLTYGDPPGGTKTCLNSKLATARVTLTRRDRPTVHLYSHHRAAFEILTDRDDHGVPVSV